MTDLASLEKRIRVLEDIEAIKNLRAKYWYAADHKLWDQFAECFTEDLSWDIGGTWKLQGRDKVVQSVSKALNPRVSVHQGLNPYIEILSDTTARGRWPLGGHIFEEGLRSERREYGYYEDEYVKQDGKWKIRSTKLTYLATQTIEKNP